MEKKRREERMRQKIWEQKHRLGSFRRRAKLPGPTETDPLMSQYDDPRMMQLTPMARRQSETGMPGVRPRRRSSRGLTSVSPIRDGFPRGMSPSRYDGDDVGLHGISPSRYEDRTRSPSRSRHGSDPDILGLSPIYARRDMPGPMMLSPKWPDSRTASPRGATVFFPDTDSLHSLREEGPPDRSLPTVDLFTDTMDGPAFMDPDLPPPRDDDDSDAGDLRYESRIWSVIGDLWLVTKWNMISHGDQWSSVNILYHQSLPFWRKAEYNLTPGNISEQKMTGSYWTKILVVGGRTKRRAI